MKWLLSSLLVDEVAAIEPIRTMLVVTFCRWHHISVLFDFKSSNNFFSDFFHQLSKSNVLFQKNLILLVDLTNLSNFQSNWKFYFLCLIFSAVFKPTEKAFVIDTLNRKLWSFEAKIERDLFIYYLDKFKNYQNWLIIRNIPILLKNHIQKFNFFI